MVNHNWWTSLTLLIWVIATYLCIAAGQSQNAIGAHRAFQKTSFSCAGRPSGYYADIETGCQVYHMCDGLGRQFSYSCPNTTLFQQRMLICDHWYMVNCSKAESDYTANLLIGQRDKPFVNDEENSQRTPRPDLLDRPYAPDYSGESFRNQYKQLPAVQNQIVDPNSQKNGDKTAAASQLSVGQQRWKIPLPSNKILPPAHEQQTEADNTKNTRGNSVRFITPTIAKPTLRTPITTTTTTRRPTAPAPAPTVRQNNAALHQRQQQKHIDADDLGTSHSTRYNTSADLNSAEVRTPTKSASANNRQKYSAFSFNSPSTTSTTKTTGTVKVPSKIYEPPFLYPIYNQDDKPSTERPLRVSTATPFTAAALTRKTTTTSTTTRPPTRPTTLAGKPFTHGAYAASTSVAPQTQTATQKRPSIFDTQKQSQNARTPTPAQGFKAPTPRPPINTAKTLRPPTIAAALQQEQSALDYRVPIGNRLDIPTPYLAQKFPTSGIASSFTPPAATKAELPAKDLLPPFKEFAQHDVATTVGPIIYYEWKAPSDGLEPPKLDPPIGTDGREYEAGSKDYNSAKATASLTSSTSFGIGQQKPLATTANKSYANNPFLAAKSQRSIDSTTTKTPTSRSIKDTAQPSSAFGRSSKPTTATAETASDLTKIKADLSVPEYSFPLENIGRTGYLASDTYNSFQLKIPERRSDNDAEHLHWFGENPKCPQCHPSYVRPGTCEPCLKR